MCILSNLSSASVHVKQDTFHTSDFLKPFQSNYEFSYI